MLFIQRKLIFTLVGLVVLGSAGSFAYLSTTGKIKLGAETLTNSQNTNQESLKPQKIKFATGEAIIKLKNSAKNKTSNSLISELKSNLKRPDDEIEQLLKTKPASAEEENLTLFYKVKLKLKTKDVKEPEFPPGFPEERKPLYNLQERETLGLIDAYKQNPNIELAEPNTLYEPNFIPNDPYFNSGYTWGQNYDDLWGTKVIQSADAWDTSQGEGVTVAVVDTGIDYNHEDIKDNIWQNQNEVADDGIDNDKNGYIDDTRGWNFYDNNNNPMDTNGHGTHVAGTIAAVGNNNIGIIGVAPKAKVMALKVGDYQLTWDAIFNAIYYAVKNGAKVINMSFGGYGQYFAFDQLLNYADSQNVVLVAAAGNDNAEPLLFTPASNPKVITVGAVDPYGQKAWFSNYGLKLDVMAPGVDTLSLKSAAATNLPTNRTVGGKYIRLDGTSMAAPHVSGAVALILAKNSNFTPSQIKYSLKKTGDDLGDPGTDLEYGYGRANALNSLSVVSPPKFNLAIQSPSFDQKIKGQTPIQGTAFSDRLFNYKLEYTSVRRPYSWTKIFEEKSAVENGLLTNWDTTSVFDEKNWVKLSVTMGGNSSYPSYTESVYTLLFPINKVKPGWPQLTGWGIDGAITLADLNNDRKEEVLVNSIAFWGGRSAAHVFNGDGSYFSGWPQYEDPWLDSAPAVADLDNDGSKDVIYGSWDGKVYARHSDGTLLPGWPQSTTNIDNFAGVIWSAPTIFDINNDGSLEVIIGDWNGYLNVFNHDGTQVAGWPKKVSGSQYAFSSTAAVGDLDGDGQVEIVVSVNNYRNNWDIINVFLPNGQEKPGWPQIFKVSYIDIFSTQSSPVLVDLDGDNKLEVIVKLRSIQKSFTGSRSARLAVLDYKGKMLRGWPREVGTGFSTPLVTNLDKDKNLEIVDAGNLYQYQSGSGGVWIKAFNYDGSQMPGWPKLLANVYSSDASVIAANIDKEGQKEILITASGWSGVGYIGGDQIVSGAKIYALRSDGTILSKAQGWPKTMGRRVWFSTPAVGDIDGDGKLELVAGSWDGVWAWDLEGPADQTGIWPMFQHDVWHTGNAGTFIKEVKKKIIRK